MKKIIYLIILLALILCISACSSSDDNSSVSAKPNKTGTPGLLYEPKVGGYVVTGYNGISADVVIPDTYADGPVIEIGEGALTDTEITSLTLGKNIKKIGNGGFGISRKLTKIVLNEGLELLDGFNDAYSLKEISVPSTVTEIDNMAFRYANQLESVKFAKGSKLYLLDSAAFAYCFSLKDINLNNTNVQIIDNHAFENCFALKELHLPASCIYFGRGVFSGWTSDQTIYMGCSRDSIGMYGSGKFFTKDQYTPEQWENVYKLIFEGCEAKIVYP